VLDHHLDFGDDDAVTHIERMLDENEDAGSDEFLYCAGESEGYSSDLTADRKEIFSKGLGEEGGYNEV